MLRKLGEDSIKKVINNCYAGAGKEKSGMPKKRRIGLSILL